MDTEIVPHLVSTIIPVYNRPEMIQSAVESVFRQKYGPIEVIIVDDGSTDDTFQVCEKLVRENSDTVQLLKQVNSGPGPAREKGRLAARGEYIQYLDSDDLLLPNKFKDQVNALRENPECGIAYGITRLIDFQGNILADPFKWSGETREELFPGLLIDRWWSTHTPLYRRAVCDQIGPWSTLRFSQDWEYDARAAALRIKLITTGTHVSEHRTHQEVRQTGQGRWLEPNDKVKFFDALLECALKAGVEKSAPETQHFSRWVFTHARKCGMEGDVMSAAQLFELACRSAVRMDSKLKAYAIASRLFGWKIAGKLGNLHDKVVGGQAGQLSMKQSWMTEE